MKYEPTRQGSSKYGLVRILPETPEEARALYELERIYDKMKTDFGNGYSMSFAAASLNLGKKECSLLDLLVQLKA